MLLQQLQKMDMRTINLEFIEDFSGMGLHRCMRSLPRHGGIRRLKALVLGGRKGGRERQRDHTRRETCSMLLLLWSHWRPRSLFVCRLLIFAHKVDVADWADVWCHRWPRLRAASVAGCWLDRRTAFSPIDAVSWRTVQQQQQVLACDTLEPTRASFSL